MSYIKRVKELTCLWEGCSEVVDISSNRYAFVKHVSFHIPEVRVVEDDNGDEMYECLWKNCHYNSIVDQEICRHIKYHAYHTRLQALGAAFIKIKAIPPCRISSFSSLLPEEELKCLWRKCKKSFTCQETFNNHVVEVHVKLAKSNSEDRFLCLWGDCNIEVTRRTKLETHVRVHTGAKAIACPNCGQSFVDSTKLKGHCFRQAPVREKGFKCSYCVKIFPTAMLLKDHTRVHVQHYKCPFCELTCRAPSSLVTHLRYRHVDSRCFKCPYCPYTCPRINDLRSHFISHKVKNLQCSHKGCSYVTSRQFSLNQHLSTAHGSEVEPKYACHVCDQRFKTSSSIGRHLVAAHQVEKPFGFYRFVYKLEEDGLKRLQTTRLEEIYYDEEDDEEFYDDEEMYERASSLDYDFSDSEVIEISNNEKISIELLDTSGKVLEKNVVYEQSELPEDAKIIAVLGENCD